jgi:cytoskeleton protein RodZ
MNSQAKILDDSVVDQPSVDKVLVEVKPAETAGEMLRTARLDAGLSHKDVADKLHILVKQVEAIELDNYSIFNAEVFCKGYIRSYAKLMGLDADLVIERYLALRVEPAVVEAKQSFSYKEKASHGNGVKYWFLVASIGILFFLWWSNNVEPDDAIIPVVNDEVIIDQNDNVVIAARNAQVISEQNADVEFMPAIAASLNADNKVADTISSSAVVSGPVMAAVNDAEGVLASAAGLATKEDLLTFLFEKDCWVEVKDSNDKLLFSGLKHAEDNLTINGLAPFSILLGYAPGVTLSHNGKLVDIDVNSKNNSARLVVDRS